MGDLAAQHSGEGLTRSTVDQLPLQSLGRLAAIESASDTSAVHTIL
jgi:hypothetical protein